jgi:hypothetical protein
MGMFDNVIPSFRFLPTSLRKKINDVKKAIIASRMVQTQFLNFLLYNEKIKTYIYIYIYIYILCGKFVRMCTNFGQQNASSLVFLCFSYHCNFHVNLSLLTLLCNIFGVSNTKIIIHY